MSYHDFKMSEKSALCVYGNDLMFFFCLGFSGSPIPRMDYTEQELKTW